jgi:hypothetical protein
MLLYVELLFTSYCAVYATELLLRYAQVPGEYISPTRVVCPLPAYAYPTSDALLLQPEVCIRDTPTTIAYAQVITLQFLLLLLMQLVLSDTTAATATLPIAVSTGLRACTSLRAVSAAAAAAAAAAAPFALVLSA